MIVRFGLTLEFQCGRSDERQPKRDTDRYTYGRDDVVSVPLHDTLPRRSLAFLLADFADALVYCRQDQSAVSPRKEPDVRLSNDFVSLSSF